MLSREPLCANWQADPINACLHIWRVVDEKGEETAEIYAVEIVGFSQFSSWEDIPDFPLVRIGDLPAQSLVSVLMQFQSQILRRQEEAL